MNFSIAGGGVGAILEISAVQADFFCTSNRKTAVYRCRNGRKVCKDAQYKGRLNDFLSG